MGRERERARKRGACEWGRIRKGWRNNKVEKEWRRKCESGKMRGKAEIETGGRFKED